MSSQWEINLDKVDLDLSTRYELFIIKYVFKTFIFFDDVIPVSGDFTERTRDSGKEISWRVRTRRLRVQE